MKKKSNPVCLLTLIAAAFLLLVAYGCKTQSSCTAGGPPAPPNAEPDIWEYQGGPPPGSQPGESKPCPWKISGLVVGRWMNGNLKASTWARGSFPLPHIVTERPIWYVNGNYIGHSYPFFNTKRLPNSSGYLKPNVQNSITVKFTKPPYAGSSNTFKFIYDPKKVKPGYNYIFGK